MNNLQGIEQTLVSVLFWCVLASSGLYLLEIAGKQVWARWVAHGAMGLSLVAALGSLVVRYVYAGYPPLSNLFESLMFLIFAMLAIFVVVQAVMKPRYFGVVTAPLVTLLIGFASILPQRLRDSHPLMPALQSYWLKIHVSLMLVSYAAFLLASGAAVVYLILYRKRKRDMNAQGGTMAIEGGGTLDASRGLVAQLAFLDDLIYRLVLVGFPVLAFGIITGGMWANHAWGTYWSWDPKETWALITWLVYAGYLHARLAHDWSGPRSAWLAILGFVSVLVTYLGVNYLAQGLHTYGSLL
ncbi:MAG: c-type cytochrome biogenesis protein CcsB [bacterium]|nr:c-type cytochrome biogenesis protein CcsB [bacterium]